MLPFLKDKQKVLFATAMFAVALGRAVCDVGPGWISWFLIGFAFVVFLWGASLHRIANWQSRARQQAHSGSEMLKDSETIEREIEEYGEGAVARFRMYYAGRVASFRRDLNRHGLHEDLRITNAESVRSLDELWSVVHALKQNGKNLKRWWYRWPLI